MECLSCGAHDYRRIFAAKETLFQTGDFFDYAECKECGSFQIRSVPADLARHYPADYYSMAAAGDPIKPLNSMRRFARGARTDYYINGVRFLGWAIDKVAPNYFQLNWEWFRGLAMTK